MKQKPVRKPLLVLVFLASFTLSAPSAAMESWSDDQVCVHLAAAYVTGSYKKWMLVVAEIQRRQLGFRCKDVAELTMMSERYAGALPFKQKLDEMFGPSPPISSEDHFLRNVPADPSESSKQEDL